MWQTPKSKRHLRKRCSQLLQFCFMYSCKSSVAEAGIGRPLLRGHWTDRVTNKEEEKSEHTLSAYFPALLQWISCPAAVNNKKKQNQPRRLNDVSGEKRSVCNEQNTLFNLLYMTWTMWQSSSYLCEVTILLPTRWNVSLFKNMEFDFLKSLITVQKCRPFVKAHRSNWGAVETFPLALLGLLEQNLHPKCRFTKVCVMSREAYITCFGLYNGKQSTHK